MVDHDYVLQQPILGGELSFHTNATSLTRNSANFDPISQAAIIGNLCGPNTADPAVKNTTNCLLRGVPGTYTRLSSEATWRRTIIDSYGQVFTPFVNLRGDVASMNVLEDQPGVANYIHTGESDVGRVMPTVGLEYRYPLISVQSWGTQTLEPIAQLILRPNETRVGAFPNEDAQSLIFDDSNLFKLNKFSGWDRVEGGSRANVGVQYTAQFNRGGNVNVLFGQSYQLFGQNSFALGGTTNTGIAKRARHDPVRLRGARVLPAELDLHVHLAIPLRPRTDFTLQRTELETTASFGRWTTVLMYGNYAAQPALGFLDRREGILANARLKLNENWVLLGARMTSGPHQVSQTQIGVGYVDDCLILALNYITDYAYSGSVSVNHTYMMQIALRTLGGTTVGTYPGWRALPHCRFGA